MSRGALWMHPHGREDGNAVVEFVVLGVLLLVPLVYLVLVLGRAQAAALAAEGAAREAGRAYVTAAGDEDATRRATAAAAVAVRDQGFRAGEVHLDLACSATPCLTPEASVSTHVVVDVRLPAVPRFVDAVVPSHVSVSARHVSTVDRFRVRR